MPQLLTSLNDLPPALLRGAVSVGNFDGVHRGHAELIGQLVSMAKRHAGPAVVMTFDPPPTALLYPERKLSPPLTSMSRRAELLFDLGVDAMIAYPTDRDLLRLTAAAFFEQKMVDALQARAMVEGPNFRFGKDRDGDVTRLQTLCADADIECLVVNANSDAQGMISSTRIRQYLLDGQLLAANNLLTQPYCLIGTVVPGQRRGRELGFPTANLSAIESLIPGPGVYSGEVVLAAGTANEARRPVAVNIGPNLTFDEPGSKVEAHIIGYAGGALYGQRLKLTLFEKIREVRKFASVDDLRAQITRDVAACASLHSN